MKIFFLLCLILSSSIAYSDCISELANLSTGIKLKGVLEEKLYGESSPYKGKKPDPIVLCLEAGQMSNFADDKDEKNKLVKLMRKELQEKKKVSKTFLNAFTDVDPAEYTTEPEICKMVEKYSEKYGDEKAPADKLRAFAKQDILNMNVGDSCKKMLELLESEQKKNESQSKVSHPEPPGEEISPAEEPIKDKSLFSEKGVPQKTESIQPAKLKSNHSGSGASSQ